MEKVFKAVYESYKNSVIDLFKQQIDEASIDAEKEQLNAFDTYIYIIDKLNAFVKDLVEFVGINDNSINFMNNCNLLLNEYILEEIDDYLENYLDAAIDYFSDLAFYVKDASTISQLKERYSFFESLLEILKERELESLFVDIDFSLNDNYSKNNDNRLTRK